MGGRSMRSGPKGAAPVYGTPMGAQAASTRARPKVGDTDPNYTPPAPAPVVAAKAKPAAEPKSMPKAEGSQTSGSKDITASTAADRITNRAEQIRKAVEGDEE